MCPIGYAVLVLFTFLILSQLVLIECQTIFNQKYTTADLRSWILSEYSENPDKYDPQDIEWIRGSTAGGAGHQACSATESMELSNCTLIDSRESWHVKRYLVHAGGAERKARDLADKVLKWRHRSGMNRLALEDFPCEFPLSGYMQVSRDRFDRALIIVDLNRMPAKWPVDMLPGWTRWLYWAIDQVDKSSILGGNTAGAKPKLGFDNKPKLGLENNEFEPPSRKGFAVLIIPAKNVSLADLSITDTKNFLTNAFNRFPASLRYFVVHEPGLAMQATTQAIVTAMGPEYKQLFRVTNGPQLYRYASRQNLPRGALGGTRSETDLIKSFLPGVVGGQCGNIWTLATGSNYKWSNTSVGHYLKFIEKFTVKNRIELGITAH